MLLAVIVLYIHMASADSYAGDNSVPVIAGHMHFVPTILDVCIVMYNICMKRSSPATPP
jgi:hypothetical protein